MKINKTSPRLADKENCSGCSVCMDACPVRAIQMQANDTGFSYPKIDTQKCIGCNQCANVCPSYSTEELNVTKIAYAMRARDKQTLKESSSGGVFAVLAQKVISKGGVVVGCAMSRKDNTLISQHILVRELEDLYKLQGSKYVQSNTEHIYEMVRRELNEGHLVLFSGTPCQVEALKRFIKMEHHPNLITVDLICHGVPSVNFFQGYIRMLEKKWNGTILDFRFRDKTEAFSSGKNPGFIASVSYLNAEGAFHEKTISASKSSYYNLFLSGNTYRDSCYQCKFACKKRAGDITIGDYWGIEKEHPSCLIENGGSINPAQGVSCVLVNTEKGQQWIEKTIDLVDMELSSIDCIANWNRQLERPQNEGKHRKQIFKFYRKYGYIGVEKWFVVYRLRYRVSRKLEKIFSR